MKSSESLLMNRSIRANDLARSLSHARAILVTSYSPCTLACILIISFFVFIYLKFAFVLQLELKYTKHRQKQRQALNTPC